MLSHSGCFPLTFNSRINPKHLRCLHTVFSRPYQPFQSSFKQSSCNRILLLGIKLTSVIGHELKFGIMYF